MRPHQWVKNLFVLAPLVFAKELFETAATLRTIAGFALFCAASSSVYILNDLADVEADRAHPIKKNRPIASGLVSIANARAAVSVLAIVALAGASILGAAFFGAIAGYFVLNLAYSARLKRIAYVDVLCIATGFELRVLGGSFAARVPPSIYLLVATFLLAAFLGFGKRMHELRQGDAAHKQRSVLRAYSRSMLGALLWATALSTIVVYLAYTLDPLNRTFFGTDYLFVTAPFAIGGVLRFLHLVRNRPRSESPTEEMLRDRLFLLNLVAWAGSVVLVIYLGS